MAVVCCGEGTFPVLAASEGACDGIDSDDGGDDPPSRCSCGCADGDMVARPLGETKRIAESQKSDKRRKEMEVQRYFAQF